MLTPSLPPALLELLLAWLSELLLAWLSELLLAWLSELLLPWLSELDRSISRRDRSIREGFGRRKVFLKTPKTGGSPGDFFAVDCWVS